MFAEAMVRFMKWLMEWPVPSMCIYRYCLPGPAMILLRVFRLLLRRIFNLSEYDNPVEMECDLLKVNGEYVLNTASIGFDVHVADYANKYKSIFLPEESFPYYMGMLASLKTIG